MLILNLSHGELGAGITLDHDWEPGKGSVGGVIIGVGLVDKDDSFGECGVRDGLLDFRVVFVEELAFCGDGGVDIAIGVIDLGHLN